ncbi:hypothetical protein HHL21_21280 [Massilia sp. RP-1-19]|uniref:Uncharacterized protein n=1 Tax=Massilia polaris TaxID=2728846 RepID=A0A848HQD4_9BURK|nr:hypothetical protein [Massilia polaris]NML63572.1 hypothetical protein [Massilia polaris]
MLLIDKAFCLSAAEKEEYEAFAVFRQPSFLPRRLFQTTLTAQQLLDFVNQFCGEANYSKGRRELASDFA